MAQVIIFLDRLINLYLYFIITTCVLSWIPNINPNYPLFHCLFKFAGFYLIPPILGFLLGPTILMILCALISMGLGKIYDKYYKPKEPQVMVLSPEEFISKLNKQNKEGNEDVSNKDNRSDS